MTDLVADAVRALVARGVRRLEALEVLLLIAKQPELAWSRDAVCASAAFAVRVALEGLASLERLGLIVRTTDGEHYQLDAGVDLELLRAIQPIYERNPVRVTNAFFACNLEILREVAARRKPLP